jgi:FkbH-like protein
LIWSPETQVLNINEEAKVRRKSLQSLVGILNVNTSKSREDMLNELNMELRVRTIENVDDEDFDRVFELLNKTNQFNTTGKRYTENQLDEILRNNSKIVVARARDRFVDHGLVFVGLYNQGCIQHVVMSCRVIGLGIEFVGIRKMVLDSNLSDSGEFTAPLEETERNQPVRNFFKNSGFVQRGKDWILSSRDSLIDQPPHLEVLYD